MIRIARRLVASFFLLLALWGFGLAWFLAQIPSPLPPGKNADAIVVLTGGGGRLEYGLQLLAEGRGKKLFISGVNESVPKEDLLKKVDAKALAKVNVSDIILGRQAENTIGNAEETANWLKKEHDGSILLVTASYHMPRSIEEFEETAPGVAIIPAPVSPAGWWWEEDNSRILLLSEYHKFIASKLRHWILSATHRP